MDIALLTANSNQLRFIMSYNMESKTYYLSLGLIIASLILQVAVGFGLIYKVSNRFIAELVWFHIIIYDIYDI